MTDKSRQVDLAPLMLASMTLAVVGGLFGGLELYKRLRAARPTPPPAPPVPPDGGGTPSS